MRVLILHSRYLSGPASGENRVVDEEAALVREAGHEVTLLARSPEAEVTGAGLVRTGVNALWSHSAAREVTRLVRDERIDVVHCHNLFPSWSTSVLPAARDAGAAVVMTLHNYRLLCLPATFLRDGGVCECCLGRIPWRGVRYRCYRNSAAGSAVLAGSLTLGRARRAFDGVTLVAVSDFVRRKHVAGGFEASVIRVKPNFVRDVARRRGSRGVLPLSRASRTREGHRDPDRRLAAGARPPRHCRGWPGRGTGTGRGLDPWDRVCRRAPA